MPAEEAPDRVHSNWYVPQSPAPREANEPAPLRPRKRSLAHVCEFPTVSLDGNYQPIGTEGVRVGRDGMARNGVVAVGFVHDEHPEVPSMPHSGIANTLVDFEDDRGRCPGDPR